MRTIAIIPARGGSKRIERKNVKPFAGVPVIAYSIRAAISSGCFDEVMVSTDDAEIAETVLRYGAKVPFMRSAETANDFATTADVIREVLDRYRERGEEFEALACIYATAPFITASRLRDAHYMIASGVSQAAFTCVEYSYPTQRCLVIDGSGRIGMKYPEYATARSQDLQKTYHDAGQFYLTTVAAFEQCGSLWGPDTRPIVLSETEVQDLDTPTDWKLAELKYSMLAFPRRFTAGDYTFVAYPELSEEMSHRLLEGRNAPDVRKQMVNTDVISADSHRSFVDSLRTRRDKQYYAVFMHSGELIGSVNLEWNGTDSMERGIWLFKSARGQGHAKRMLREMYQYFALERGVRSFTSFVRRDNEASIALEHSLRAVEEKDDGTYRYFRLSL